MGAENSLENGVYDEDSKFLKSVFKFASKNILNNIFKLG